MSKHGKLIGDGPTEKTKKAVKFLRWFSIEGFIENMVKLAIGRERAKKAKREKAIQKNMEMVSKHAKAIRDLTMKIAENQKKALAGQKKLAPITPGEVLREEFLKPNKITWLDLSQRTRIPIRQVRRIMRGEIEITNETAIQLGEYFNIEAEFWLNLQSRYNLKIADRKTKETA